MFCTLKMEALCFWSGFILVLLGCHGWKFERLHLCWKSIWTKVFKVSKKFKEMQHNGGDDDLEGTKLMAIFCL
jgi:hypothetical protein